MLNKVIQDIYHLRRVHAVLPDAVLGDTLKNKLLRLSLQPSLQELKHRAQQAYTSAHEGNQPSSLSSGSRWGHGGGTLSYSPYTINPSALCNLLDSLAYFHLGSSAVAKEAVQLVQLSAPSMSVPQLCTTLAACCALGAQTDITATALPLLSTALNSYTGPSSLGDEGAAAAASAAGSYKANEAPLLFSQGNIVLLLMEALQRAGVEDVQVWHLLAEHCLRYLDSFDGRQLCNVIEGLCAEGIDDYPDFFVAAERHITSQPSNYLSPDQLQRVVRCYKDLHQPVVSLLALVNATPLHGEDVERSISAAAAVVAFSSSSDLDGCGKGSRGAADASQTTRGATLHPSLEAFEGAAITAVASADAQGVLDLLQKCEQRRVMTARAMDAILERLLGLYYPELRSGAASAAAAKSTEGASTTVSATDAAAPPPQRLHAPLELHHLSQALVAAFEFNDAALFAQQLPTAASPGEGEKTPTVPAKPAAVTALLDALAGELTRWYHHRVLQLVRYALRLLPAPSQPHTFYRAVVDHLRRSNDLSSHEGPPQLRSLIDALLALRAYGGEAILVQYMPAITVAVQNTPRSTQLELTALLANLPCAKEELIPGVYRQWGSQKRWLRTITEEEVGWALQIMSRSGGLRDSQILHAVLEYVQAQRAQLPPQRVVEYLHQLARLGVRDLEFFTQTAEKLMRRAVESSPSVALAARGGAAQPVRASSSTSQMMVRHQQWQVTTVHDLCLLLFTFTFVLRDSIRVTQQIISRLKMCASSAAPRDISLALYSFVKLRVAHNDEVTGQLCERACATLAEFRAAELASMWSSLRCLRHPHRKLRQQTLDLLGASNAAVCPKWRFADNDCVSLGSALLLTEALPFTADQPLVPPQAHEDSTAAGGADDGETAALPGSSATAGRGVGAAVLLPPVFERHFVEVCQRLLPAATGQRLYLILCSLSACQTSLNVPVELWEKTLTTVDTHAESLSTGTLGELVGTAQLEVLAALRRLRACVADPVALATLEVAQETMSRPSAVKKGNAGAAGSGRWVTPYCPPRLWSTLRPQWRELTCSAAVLARPELMEVVVDIKGGGDYPEVAAEAKAGRRSAAASAKKPTVRKGRPVKAAAHLV
ncbi:conserved hypothetical protein [Leishmania mexicana MHOM/GT/2001/U1103]|uniref:Uncharacterized protein n=1 Tax=Leishmania mexicana (strain MHOM/GT/2001/U1103) TaxID=929439 RepID=E9B3B7_LEIMU|nr:conserved hypothetical protein [Leishmania mexicana MHOM/GT/2001/U1103]CBZ29734.1 conserved hypothetical protein [Leishmania mexicana MHOM/GT/2001/U1103]